MEYLPPILSCHISLDKYFPTFCLLTHLAAKNIRARGVLNKNRLYKYTIIGDKQQQKKGYVVALNITHQARKTVHILQWLVGTATECTSSHSEVFLEKAVLKMCSKFTREQPCQSAVSINLQSNFIEIALRYGCSPVNLLHIFRTPFPKNTSGRLLLRVVYIACPKSFGPQRFVWCWNKVERKYIQEQ